jgi:hypothetical protein
MFGEEARVEGLGDGLGAVVRLQHGSYSGTHVREGLCVEQWAPSSCSSDGWGSPSRLLVLTDVRRVSHRPARRTVN